MNRTKRTLVLGSIAGLFMISWWFIGALGGNHEEAMSSPYAMLFGYLFMLIGFVTVFIGIKQQRDKVQEGVISFTSAFGTGMLIVLVASTIYVLGWEIFYPNFFGDFTADYMASQIASIEANTSLSAEEQAEQIAAMQEWGEDYQKPLIRMGYTLMEILPVGLLVSLIAAAILKRKTAPEA